MIDIVLVTGLVLACAILLTVHVAIIFGLLFRPPRWRAVVALFLAPFAPYWAWRERMFVRATIWMAALVIYVVARLAASM